MALVTTIVPFYNEAELLPRCIESIRGQTHADLQILLVNDGSTDDSGAIADDYAKRDPRITAVHLNKSGVSVARNAGIEAAQGEFMHFVDADDYLLQDMVEHLVEKMRHEDADFATCDVILEIAEPDGTTIRTPHLFPLAVPGGAYSVGEIYPLLKDVNLLFHIGAISNKLYRTSTIKRSGVVYRPGLARGQDLVFNADLLPHCRKVLLGDRLLYVHAQETSQGKEAKVRTYHPQLLGLTTIFCRKIASDARSFCTPGQLHGIMAAMADRAVVDIVRHCRRDSTLPDHETKENLANLIEMPDIQEWFRHYRPGPGQSRIIPFFYRIGWVKPLFYFARRRADARYGLKHFKR